MEVCVPLDPPNYIHFFLKTSNDRMNKSNGHCFFVSHFIMALIQILYVRINEKKEKQYDKFQHN